MRKTKQTTAESAIPTTPLRYLWHVSKPYKWWMIAAMLTVSTGALITQSSSYFYKFIVDAVERNEFDSVVFFVILYPLVYWGAQFLMRLSGFFGKHWSIGARKTSYEILSSYVLKHSHAYFSNRFAGSILSKTNNVASALDNIIPDFLWSQLNTSVFFVVTLGILFTVDVLSAIILFLLLPILFLTNFSMSKKKRQLSRAHAQAGTALRGRIVDTLTNIGAVRQYAGHGYEKIGLDKVIHAHWNSGRENWGYTEKVLLVNTVVLLIFSLSIFTVLAYRFSSGGISAGEFILVLALMSQLSMGMLFIGRTFNSTAQAFGEMSEGLDDILIPYEIEDSSNAKKLVVKKAEIVFQNTAFHFGENKVFDTFNLTIESGQRVGLVGASGAGKSTFVSLLLRQHDIDGGKILIDGQNITEVTQDSLREAIAVVPQEPALFHRSIRENIAYGKVEATDEEVIDVAKKAQAHEFIATLPEGYNTLVGERGVKLSGGQRQRIAIARAMIKNAPILVLDEATSALDSESEVLIQKALHELMEGKTVIAIAHRLSTLREMDRIIVLESGRIIEDGTHGKLLEKNGVYARLWKHQAGGFLVE